MLIVAAIAAGATNAIEATKITRRETEFLAVTSLYPFPGFQLLRLQKRCRAFRVGQNSCNFLIVRELRNFSQLENAKTTRH